MIYKLLISKIAEKELSRLSLKDINRVDLGLQKILINPFSGKKLIGKLQGTYSIRVWPFRILYEIKKRKLIIIVVKVAHRKNAYK